MNSALENPAVQSAVIPFVITLVLVFALKRFGWLWAGIGLLVGVYSCVYLAFGFSMTPLTSTRKIILVGIIAFVIAMLIDVLKWRHRFLNYALAIGGSLAAAWIVWRFAMREEGFMPWLIVFASMFYTGFIIYTSEKLASPSNKGLSNILMLAIATSICAVLGASASFGQLSGAIAAATGVYYLFHLVKGNVYLHHNISLTTSTLLGLIGISSVVYASLPWYILVMLAFIPIMLFIPLPERIWKFPKLIIYTLYCLPVTGIAIFVTLQVAGAPPF